MDSPHTKAHLLFQAHLSRLPVPTDYVTDLRSVLDQCVRIIQVGHFCSYFFHCEMRSNRINLEDFFFLNAFSEFCSKSLRRLMQLKCYFFRQC